jgi:hypothetical protein
MSMSLLLSVKQCKKKSYHEWKQCPFAHPGEKARRRPGRSFPAMCPDANAPAGCPRGDACSNAHSLVSSSRGMDCCCMLRYLQTMPSPQPD